MSRVQEAVMAPHLVHEKIERRRRERIEADRKARYRRLILFLLRGEESPVRDHLDAAPRSV